MAILKLALFSVCACLIITIGVVIVNKKVHSKKMKNSIFIIVAILTVLIHYSSMFVHFYNGDFFIEDNMFLPVYPCNVMMWINFILIFLIAKRNKAFEILAVFSFWCGTICGFVGLAFNKNYLNNPNFFDYDILKGLLSHVTMLYCSIYLGATGYIKIRTVNNLKSLLIGAFILVVCSYVSDLILEQIGREPVNGMLLKPLEETPIASFYTISFVGLILFMLITTIYENYVYKDEAWFRTIRKKEENDERSFN